MIRMKSRDLTVYSCKICFLAAATVATLFIAGCSSSSHPEAAAGPSGDAQTGTVFGDEMALTGYEIHSLKEPHPPFKEQTEIELRWTALRKPAADYVVFVHALDSAGGIAFQADHHLKNADGLPATSWAANEAVNDRFVVTPANGHPPGTYPLRIGLYTVNPMKLLQVTRPGLPSPADGWKTQSILLAQVDCK